MIAIYKVAAVAAYLLGLGFAAHPIHNILHGTEKWPEKAEISMLIAIFFVLIAIYFRLLLLQYG